MAPSDQGGDDTVDWGQLPTERGLSESEREVAEQALRRHWDQARRRWPGLGVTFRHFAHHVIERLTGTGPLDDRLGAVKTEDLYLAAGCEAGDGAALTALERHIFPSVAKSVGRSAADASEADEAVQKARTKLLLAEEDVPPRIRAYSGRGPLINWVRAVALRELIDLQRSKRPEEPLEPSLTDALPLVEDAPELEFLKREHHTDFKAALAAAFQTLSPRERTLIRMYAVDGLRLEQIGALHRVDKSSVSRWLAKARRSLFEETRKNLRDKLGLSGSELDSLMRLLRSQLSLSLGHLLPMDVK